MRAIFDFTCNECGITDDFYIENDVRVKGCECGGRMEKDLCAPSNIKIGKFSTHLSTEKWAKTREKNSKRVSENNGI